MPWISCRNRLQCVNVTETPPKDVNCSWRRLVERGVRFVQLWHGKWQPWDNHDAIENHRQLLENVREALLPCSPIPERGMLDDTLVLWGEFGRTPTVEQTNKGESKLGRDHNHYGFRFGWLGEGSRRMTYGATDPFGFKAIEKPVHVHDLHATLLHLMGMDHERLTYRYASRDFRLTDVHGRVI